MWNKWKYWSRYTRQETHLAVTDIEAYGSGVGTDGASTEGTTSLTVATGHGMLSFFVDTLPAEDFSAVEPVGIDVSHNMR